MTAGFVFLRRLGVRGRVEASSCSAAVATGAACVASVTLSLKQTQAES